MPFALESTGLESVDLTTEALVSEALRPATGVLETGLSGGIAQIISDISAEFTRYLGYHTLSAERTDTYELGRGKRVLTLDARPVTVAPDSIKVALHPSSLATATAIESTDYTLHPAAGWIRFHRRLATGPVYVQMTYTGGIGVDADDVVANDAEIAYAASLQCAYRLQRNDSLGGNFNTLAGGSTQFTGQYRFLLEVQNILSARRRLPG